MEVVTFFGSACMWWSPSLHSVREKDRIGRRFPNPPASNLSVGRLFLY